MKISSTFFKYITKSFLVNIFFILLVLSTIAFLVSSIEIMRRSFVADFTFSEIIKINLINIPIIIDEIMPYTLFIATIYSIEKMRSTKELIAINSFGVSFFTAFLPAVVSTLLMSILYVIIIHPLVSNSHAIYNKMKNSDSQKRIVTFSQNGIWLKDALPNGNTIFLSADYFYDVGKYLADVKIYEYMPSQKEFTIYFCDTANFLDKQLALTDVTIIKAGSSKPEYKKQYILSTNISSEDIFEILSPKFFSIWNISEFISTLKKSGFSVISHEFYFYKLIFSPLFNISVVLVAMAISLLQIANKSMKIILYFFSGFMIYFICNLSYKMAASGSLEYYVPILILPLTINLFAFAIILWQEE